MVDVVWILFVDDGGVLCIGCECDYVGCLFEIVYVVFLCDLKWCSGVGVLGDDVCVLVD